MTQLHTTLLVANISGPSLAPGVAPLFQGVGVWLPPNRRSGGKPHLLVAGEVSPIPAVAEAIVALRPAIVSGHVEIRREVLPTHPRFVATGPVASLDVEFGNVITGVVTLPHWVRHDPAVDATVDCAFAVSDDNGASWTVLTIVPAAPSVVVPALLRPSTLDSVTWDSSAVANGTYHMRMTTTPAGSPDIIGPFRVEN